MFKPIQEIIILNGTSTYWNSHLYARQKNISWIIVSWQFPQAQIITAFSNIKYRYLYLIIMVHVYACGKIDFACNRSCTQLTLPFSVRNLPASSYILSLYMFLSPWFVNFTCPCIYPIVCFCILYRSIYYKPHSSFFVLYFTCPYITYLTAINLCTLPVDILQTSQFVQIQILYLSVCYCIYFVCPFTLHTSQFVFNLYTFNYQSIC